MNNKAKKMIELTEAAINELSARMTDHPETNKGARLFVEGYG